MKNTNNTLAAIQLTQVIEQLEDLLFCDLVTTYNDYASANHYELIHDNDEENINTLFNTPYEAAQAVVYGKYNPNDDYVTLDGYSNTVSFSYHPIQDDNCPIDVSELAQWLINEDKLSEYDISVTTLDDILSSIEDNITDDNELLKKLTDYVDKSVFAQDALMINKYNECNDFIIYEYMNMIGEYSYKELSSVINHLGINYQ